MILGKDQPREVVDNSMLKSRRNDYYIVMVIY